MAYSGVVAPSPSRSTREDAFRPTRSVLSPLIPYPSAATRVDDILAESTSISQQLDAAKRKVQLEKQKLLVAEAAARRQIGLQAFRQLMNVGVTDAPRTDIEAGMGSDRAQKAPVGAISPEVYHTDIFARPTGSLEDGYGHSQAPRTPLQSRSLATEIAPTLGASQTLPTAQSPLRESQSSLRGRELTASLQSFKLNSSTSELRSPSNGEAGTGHGIRSSVSSIIEEPLHAATVAANVAAEQARLAAERARTVATIFQLQQHTSTLTERSVHAAKPEYVPTPPSSPGLPQSPARAPAFGAVPIRAPDRHRISSTPSTDSATPVASTPYAALESPIKPDAVAGKPRKSMAFVVDYDPSKQSLQDVYLQSNRPVRKAAPESRTRESTAIESARPAPASAGTVRRITSAKHPQRPATDFDTEDEADAAPLRPPRHTVKRPEPEAAVAGTSKHRSGTVSNKQRIINALQTVCLAGTHRRSELDAALAAVTESGMQTFLVLLASPDSLSYRALYSVEPITNTVMRIHGAGPADLTRAIQSSQPAASKSTPTKPVTDEEEVSVVLTGAYKYSTGQRKFEALPTMTVGLTTDAISIKVKRSFSRV